MMVVLILLCLSADVSQVTQPQNDIISFSAHLFPPTAPPLHQEAPPTGSVRFLKLLKGQ